MINAPQFGPRIAKYTLRTLVVDVLCDPIFSLHTKYPNQTLGLQAFDSHSGFE